MSMKLTDYIVAGLIVGLFTAVFITAFISMSDKYGTTSVTANLSGYQRYNETLAQVEALDQTNISQTQGTFDIIGDFFSQGYSAFKLTRNSISLIDGISTDALKDSQIDTEGHFKMYFSAILLVIFVLGILAVALNRDI